MLHDLKQQLILFSQVTIGDGSQLNVLGHGKVVISPNVSIEKVLLVESLGYNLLSVLQLCQCNYEVVLSYTMCLYFMSFLLK